MKYAYENLSDGQFELLITFLCQKLLGISVQAFCTGADGGRDAKFSGTAELHPSKANPWVGLVVIQGKHTNGYNRSFSETDFFAPKPNSTCIVAKEMPRIKALRESKQLDHYMLFANRRLSAIADADIVSFISAGSGIPASSIFLCGLEQLDLWMKLFPDVAKNAELDPVDSPLIIKSGRSVGRCAGLRATQGDGQGDPSSPARTSFQLRRKERA